jgi:hypothetical protein
MIGTHNITPISSVLNSSISDLPYNLTLLSKHEIIGNLCPEKIPMYHDMAHSQGPPVLTTPLWPHMIAK